MLEILEMNYLTLFNIGLIYLTKVYNTFVGNNKQQDCKIVF